MEMELVTAAVDQTSDDEVELTRQKDSAKIWALSFLRYLRPPRHEPRSLQTEKRELHPRCPGLIPSKNSRTERETVSINGHQGVEVSGKCYVLPTMIIDEHHLQIWQSQIKERLEDEIPRQLQKERCLQLDFWMVSDSKGRTGPCIIFTCWDEANCQDHHSREKIRKRIQNKVKHFQALKDCRYPYIVVMDTISLLAKIPEDIDVSSNTVMAELHGDEESFVGLMLKGTLPPHYQCTLGGLVSIDGHIYGLTVAHPFEAKRSVAEADASENLVEDGGLSDSECSDVKSSSSGAQSLLFDSRDNIGLQDFQIERGHRFPDRREEEDGPAGGEYTREITTTGTLPSRPTSRHSEGRTTSSKLFGRIVMTSAFNDVIGAHISHNYDWALVEIDANHQLRHNSYIDLTGNARIFLQGTHQNNLLKDSQVSVLAGQSGLKTGTLIQQQDIISISGRDLHVSQILLEHPLGKRLRCNYGNIMLNHPSTSHRRFRIVGSSWWKRHWLYCCRSQASTDSLHDPH